MLRRLLQRVDRVRALGCAMRFSELHRVGRGAWRPNEDGRSLVEYASRGSGESSSRFGILVGPEGKRCWRVLDVGSGTERRVNRYDVRFKCLLDGLGLDEVRCLMRSIDEKLELVKVDAYEVWKNFEWMDGDTLSYEKVAKYIFKGFFESELFDFFHGLAAHVYLSRAPIYFERGKDGTYRCRSREEVRMELEWAEREEKVRSARGRFIEIVKDKLNGKEVEFEGENEALLKELKGYALSVDMGSVNGDLGMNVLKPLGYADKPEGAYRLLIDLGVFSHYTNPHVQRHAMELIYSEEYEWLVEKELGDRGARREQGRVDLSEFEAFAIDADEAQEIDDVISLVIDGKGRDWVYIHVVDVAFYMDANSKIDLESRSRGASVYLPDRHFGMLPGSLERRLSFGSMNRRALSFGALLNEAGEIEEWEVSRSRVGPVRRVTFDQVDRMMSSKVDGCPRLVRRSDGEFERAHRHVFSRLLDFATKRRALRLSRRAAMFSLPDPYVRVELSGRGVARVHVGLQRDWLVGSRGMVTEYMLLAGEVAAMFASSRKIPFLYQSQSLLARDSSLKSRAFYFDFYGVEKRSLAARWFSQLELMRGLGSKEWSSVAKRHEAQGLLCYASITSPLRRYVDLLAHHQLHAFLSGRRVPFSAQECSRMLPGIREAAGRAEELRRRGTRFWILGCLEELCRRDGGRRYEAMVSSTKTGHRNEYAIRLMEFGIEERVFCRRELRYGEVVSVKVEMVNPFYDLLILKMD